MYRKIQRFLREHKNKVFTFLFIAIFFSLFAKGHAVVSIILITTISVALLYLVFRLETINIVALPLLLLMLYYVFIAITGLWSIDLEQYRQSIQLKSVLLGIPFIFLVYHRFPREYFKIFSYFLVTISLCCISYVLYNFSNNSQEYLRFLESGRSIPVPFRNHIRFSIFLNFVLILSLFNTHRIQSKKLSLRFIFWGLISTCIFFFIQFLAVKTGIVMSFIIIISYMIHKVLKSRDYMIGITILVSTCLISILILSKIPTVKNKWAYFKYDIQQMKSKNSKNFSDGERLISIKHGLKICKENIWKGVGEGGVRKAMKLRFPNDTLSQPHNQFVVTLSQNGIVGLLLLGLSFISFIAFTVLWKNWMLFSYSIAMLFCLMVEPMLETQIGIILFTLPLCLLYTVRNVHKS